MLDLYFLFSFAWLASFVSVGLRGSFFSSIQAKWVVYLSAIVVVGLRYATVDYFNYEHMFYRTEDVSLTGALLHRNVGTRPIESFYSFLTIIFKDFWGWMPETFFLVIAVIAVTLKFYSFQKMSSYFFLSVFLYLGLGVFRDLEQVRTGLAASFLLVSIYHVHRNNLPTAVVWCVLGAQSHVLALAFLPLIVLLRCLNFPPRLLGWVFLVSVATLFVDLSSLMRFVLTDVLNQSSGSRIVRYFSAADNGRNLFGGSMQLVMVSGFACILCFDKLTRLDEFNKTLLPAFLFSLSASFLLFDFSIVSNRLIHMISLPLLVTILPSFVSVFRQWRWNYLAFGALSGYATLTFFINARFTENVHIMTFMRDFYEGASRLLY